MTLIDFPKTTPKVEKISASVMRALRAVERGEVYRKVRNRTSMMVGPMGVGPMQFWRCAWAKLIEDGPKSGPGTGETASMVVKYQQILTETGKQALATGEFQS